MSAPSAHDVCVIGGGVTGAGVARDLSLRGLSVLLLEKGDDLYRLDHLERDREFTWESYNPEDVRAMLTTTVDSWADLDTEAMITGLYRAREKGS